MKQHIKKIEWDELSRLDKIKFLNNITGTLPEYVKNPKTGKIEKTKVSVNYSWKMDYRPSIGDLIEFLGDDLWLDVFIVYQYPNDSNDFVPKEEICDRLWDATKDKLRQ